MHQQTACQKSSVRHDSVRKHSQKQVLIGPTSTSFIEFGVKTKQENTAIPGLSYIGSDNNLSNSMGRSLEDLRGVRDKNEPQLQILEKKKGAVTSERSARRKNGVELTCV